MDEADAVHPRDGATELAPYPADERLVDACVLRRVVDQVQELPAAHVLEHETVMRRGAE